MKKGFLRVTRAEIMDGVQQILDALEYSDIAEALAPQGRLLPGTARERDYTAIFAALKRWTLRAEKFNVAAQETAEILRLENLSEPVTWSELMSDTDASSIYENVRAISFATKHLPKMLTLLERPTDKIMEKGAEKAAQSGTFSLVLQDDPDGFIQPERLIQLLNGTQHIYEACAILNGIPPDTLRVAATDSGSDLIVTFTGTPAVVGCLLFTFATIYRLLVMIPPHLHKENAKAVNEQLAQLIKINEAEEENKITPEQAGRIRHNLDVGLDDIIDARVYVQEVEAKEVILSPRALVASKTKLLTGPAEDVQQDSSSISQPLQQQKKFNRKARSSSVRSRDVSGKSLDEQILRINDDADIDDKERMVNGIG